MPNGLLTGTSSRTRRRRWLVVVAAVGAVAVLAVGPWLVGLGNNDRSPADPAPSRMPSSTPSQEARTLDDLPAGEPPTVPYLEGGALHAQHVEVETAGNRVLAEGSTVLVGRTGRQDAKWWLLADDQLTRVPDLDGIFDPRMSPSGDLLVWTSYPDAQTTRVTAWSPYERREVDHVDLDAPYAECCGGGQQIELLGIDGKDTIYWTDTPGVMVWRTARDTPRRLAGAEYSSQITPTGPVVPAGDTAGLLGEVDEAGRWSQVAELPDQSGMWSGDGSLMAYGANSSGDVAFKQSPTDEWVLDVISGRRTRLELDVPAGTKASPIRFESVHQVLVDAFTDPRRHYVLRCSTSDGRCERALPPGRIGRWTFPDRMF